MRDTRVPLSFCGGCGEKLDGSTDPTGDAVPKPGDLSVCAYCGRGHVFAEDLRQRPVTEEEFDALDDATKRTLVEYVLRIAAKPLEPFTARLMSGRGGK